MSIDFHELGKRWKITYQMVTPASPNSTMGTLEGVIPSSATITESYYTDTRVQGQLQYVGDGWVRQSFIRIIAEVPDEGYKEELGTFLATSDDAQSGDGEWKTTLALESMLYALDVQAGKSPWTVKKGAMALAAMKQMLSTCHRPYALLDPKDHKMTKNTVYETGTSYLERLYDLSDLCNDRLDVDGHGRVTIEPYIVPSKRSASFTIDMGASNGIAVDGISRSSNYLDRPTECVVYHREGSGDSEKETRGYASNSGRVSFGSRGYVITKVVELSDMSPNTAARANAIAKDRLANASSESIEWTVTTEYMPIHAGDVGWLQNTGDPVYTTRQKVMVKNRELELEHMTMKLTLKLASGSDTDTEE